jgi:hypothetical protein
MVQSDPHLAAPYFAPGRALRASLTPRVHVSFVRSHSASSLSGAGHSAARARSSAVTSAGSQVSPGTCVLECERAPALNPELRRSSMAALLPLFHQRASITVRVADVQHGRVHVDHHDARLSGGPRLGQATPLRSVRFAAYGLDRSAAPPGVRKCVMASRLTVATRAERKGSSSRESRRYDPIPSAAQWTTTARSASSHVARLLR